jgi:tol-pal system protein YbgF
MACPAYRIALFLLGVVVLGFAAPAHAGLFDDTQARADIVRLREELARVQAQLDLASRNQFDFAASVEALKADIARLQGQVEVMTNQQESATQRVRDLYVDMDNRLRKLETASPPPGAPASAPQVGMAGASGEALRDYEAALNIFKTGQTKDALAAFQSFIKSHPQSSLLASATFWAASCHAQLKDYPAAIWTFDKVATAWPQDPKAPDALLAKADTQLAAGQTKNAQASLEALITRYPTSAAAQTCRERLSALKTPPKKHR